MMRWFLQRVKTADVEVQRAARLVVAFAAGTSFAAFLFAALFYYLTGPVIGLFCGALGIPIASSALVLRVTGQVKVAAHCYLLSLWVLITGVAFVLGGVTSPGFPAYGVLILGATFMVGRRTGIIWTMIVIVSTVTVQFAAQRWVLIDGLESEPLMTLELLGLITVLVLVCLFALQQDLAKDSALEALRRANQRTAQMIVRLEHASERLVSSSERFLGARGDTQTSLIGRMMQKARDGRTSIEESRASVAGMIEQYRHISSRVQHLYRYSQMIVELVSTIDRISDRLDLMALNVGIEASHSGEAGKQFSILATDMRALAERVLTETKQIKSALQKVHEQIREVLDSSATGQELTEESANKINAMADTFDEIYTLVEETESATGLMTDDTLAQIDAVRRLVSAAARAEAQAPTR
ncbi:MAG: hypothetical protein Tsb0020_00770 [Haliangiales bacterium]